MNFKVLQSASNSETDWSGELYSGYLGLDTNLTPEIVLGVGVSTNEGNFDYDVSSAEQLNFMSSSNSIYPYFGWKSSQNESEFQATIGFGNGEVLINQSDHEADKLHSQHTSISLGGKIDLASNFEELENQGINLAVQGSTLYSQQKLLGQESILEDSEVSTHQYDFAITGVKDLAFENGSILSPFMSIGVHGEKIIEDSINGMEYRSGFEFNTPTGFSIASTGNLLLDQIDHIYRWTLNSTLDFDP